MKLESAIFDWSGTISDDQPYAYEGARYTIEKITGIDISFDEYKREFKLPYMDFYRKYTDVDRDVLEGIFAERFSALPNARPIENAPETIRELKQMNVGMAILSGVIQKSLEKQVKEYGIHDCFDLIKGSVNDKIKNMNQIIDICGFDRQKTAYVCDMVHDVEAATSAGIRSIALDWEPGYDSREMLESANPDEIIKDIRELVQFF